MRKVIRWTVVSLLLFAVLWAVAEWRQRALRERVEALLGDITSLRTQTSQLSDVQKLMNRWGRWGTRYGDCNSAKGCTYDIRLDDQLFDAPDFAYQEGFHLGARMLDHIGLRTSRVYAGVQIAHGVVTAKKFGLDVTLPFRDWHTSNTYWPSLDAEFNERNEPMPLPLQHELYYRRIRLEAVFTPEESPAEKKALTDFRFDCITRWRPCEMTEEIVPEMYREIKAVRPWINPPH